MAKSHFEIKHFRQPWELGFDKQVLPIIQGTKRPGVRYATGNWGCPPDWWNSLRLNEDQLDQVQSFYGNMPPSIGFRCEQLLFVDVDVVDPRLIERIEQILIEVLGYLPPKRWGRRPGYMLRIAKSMRSLAKIYLPKDAVYGEAQAIDFLGEGRQFVVAGLHMDTGFPYWWEGGLPHFNSLKIVTEQQIREIYRRIAALPGADAAKVIDFDSNRPAAGEGETAPPEEVRAVVMGCMPNNETYADFETWMKVCYAIINTVGPAEGYHLALDWTATQQGHEPDMVKAEKAITDFCRNPRGESGYATLLKFARDQVGWPAVRRAQSATAAEVWFVDEPEPEPVSEAAAPQGEEQSEQPKAEKPKVEPYALIPFCDLHKAPKIQWLVDEMMPHGELACFYGDSRAFKSFCALDLAHRIVHGFPDWGGMKLGQRRHAHVIYISGEGIQGLARRHDAWITHHDLPDDNDRLLLMGDQVELVDEKVMSDLAKALARHAKGKPIDLVIIDTFGRAIGDNENDTDVMRRALNCCETFQKKLKTTVLLVHHLNKKGIIRGNMGLFNGANTMAEFTRPDEKLETLMTATKVKDSREGDQWQCVFMMEKVADSIVPVFIKRMTADQREAKQSRASARSELGQSNLMDVLAALNELPQARGTVKQITAKLDGKLTRRTVQDKIDILIERGLVKQSGIHMVHGGRSIVYQAENTTLGDDPGGSK